MKKARIQLWTAVFACGLSAFLFADTVDIPGGTLTFTGATSTNWVNGDFVMTFADPAAKGTFSFPGTAQARALVIGGGGAGGSIGVKSIPQGRGQIGRDMTGAAGGGGAGGFSDRKIMLPEGTYTVSVGKGGKTAQTVVSSWVGGEGGESSLKRGTTNVFVVVGGGGGGASKAGGGGMAGGSGGGGSWYGAALRAGTGVEGLGYDGGTPIEAAIGGGGGGAGGKGKADGTAGGARVSDITGESVEYAPGGRGGRRGDNAYTAVAGALPGAGGDGAGTAAGGAGANGIVIVRIQRLFTWQDVPEPTYMKSAYFTNNTAYIAFDLAKQDPLLQEAILAVKGETNAFTSISADGTVTNGYGRHTFSIQLKDGYRWAIGTNTTTSAYTGAWRIVDEGTIGLASVEIWKSVTWNEGDKAKIDIDVHLVPETRKGIPDVLFLSGLCFAHGYTNSVAEAAINAVTAVGNIDYYFFDTVSSTGSAAPKYHDSLKKGQTFSAKSIVMKTNNHAPLYGFYETIWDLIQQGKKYDYVIFSFDRTKVAVSFPAAHPHEAEVSAFLAPIYKNNAVLWLVDHEPNQCDTLDIVQTPWYPTQLVYIKYDGSYSGWTTLAGYKASANSGWDNNMASAQTAYNALIGMFSPSKYPVSSYSEPTLTSGNYPKVQNNPETINIINQTAGVGVDADHQTLYDNAERVADLIKKAVVPKSFKADVRDKVCVHMGLDVKDANGSWTTNESTMGWTTLRKPDEIEITDTGVNILLTNLWDEAWIKFAIDVEDTGTFLNNQNATYNELTGKWEKDPNDGPVRVEMRPDGEEALVAEAEAKTSVNWAFEAYNVTAYVKTGPQTGTTAINGYYVPSLSVSEGYSPEVVFNGAPGYVLTYLEIDGEEITDYDPGTASWVFPKIHANHSVVVGYEKVDMKLIRAKQRYPWNNLVDIDYFIGGAELGKTGAMYGRLIFFVEYEDPKDPSKRVRTQLRTFRDNAKMFYNSESADPGHPDHWPQFGNQIDINTETYAGLRTPGYHRVTWDSNADGVAVFQKKKVNFTMYAVQGTDK